MANTTATAPPGALYGQAHAFSLDLEARQTHAADQMLAAWADVYARVRAEYEPVLAKIAQAQADGTPISPAWLYQRTRLKAALASTKAQIDSWAQDASATTVGAHQAAVLAAAKHAAKLGSQAMQESGLGGSFTHLNPANLEHLAGFLADGTPLSDLFAGMGDQVAAQMRHTLIVGVTLGKNPRWMARQIDQTLDVPRHRALTIMRTETHRAYRSVARQTYAANDDVLDGWTWVAHLDVRTCPACVAMDGTAHAVTETLDGHPNCRCAMVPRTKSWADLGVAGAGDTRPPVRKGTDWLEAQPAAVQREILGRAKWQAWQDGKITLDDLVARTASPQWGTMRRERSLREIQDGLNANWDDVIEHAPVKVRRSANPRAAAGIKATQTLEQVQAALDGDDLTAQQRLDYAAAKIMHLNDLEYTVALPGPDEAKAAKAVEKMDAAVLTKGYPSKGYSQTVAIYKAQANGTVGTKVGVVKSLTWEQKVTAQHALDVHNSHLPDLVATVENNKAILKAHDEGLAMHDDAIKYATWEAHPHQAYDDAIQHALNGINEEASEAINAWTGAGHTEAPFDQPWYKAITAKREALLSREDAYDTARSGLIDKRSLHGDEWVAPDGITRAVINDDGWVDVTGATEADDARLDPITAAERIADWQPAPLEPDPEAVANWVKSATGPDGYLNPDMIFIWEKALSSDDPAHVIGSPQGAADLKEALGVAKATILPKPDAESVAQALKLLEEGKIVPEKVNIHLNGDAWSPQLKSNWGAAMEQYEANLAAKAKGNGWLAHYTTMLDTGGISPGELQKVLDDHDTGVFTEDEFTAMKAALDLHYQHQGGGPAPKAEPAPPVHGPDVATLTDTGKVLGTHGARVYRDPNGNDWLFKAPKDSGDQFLATLDEVAGKVTARAGLTTPDTYVVTLGGKRGSLQRMFPSEAAFKGGFKPSTLSPADMLAVQKEHVIDWLLSNHDGHRDQFLRLPDGTLVGIDKGQAFRWFGQDRLDWDFHPNSAYGAPEPVYNALYRGFAQGQGWEVNDPSQGPLADFIKSVQAISDDDLRAMLRPYAEQAAAAGKLAVPQPNYPGVTKATLPSNDVDAFLDAVVARKNGIDKDFRDLYERAAKERHKANPDWTPTKPSPGPKKRAKKGVKAWEGAPEPEPPKAPKPPDQAGAEVFNGWLAKAEARYAANPNKAKSSLKETANWPRFERVMAGDRQAVQELHDRKYLDDAMRDEALALIERAEKVKAAAKVDYDKAKRKYDRDHKAWLKDVAEWREANGIVISFRGMDEGVKRHGTNPAGVAWANRHWSKDRWTNDQRIALQTYTGNMYQTWNTYLRTHDGDPGPYAAMMREMDDAMPVQPVPEDVIVNRGTGMDSFTVNGERFGYGSANRMEELVGTVQMDYAYMSTSVGKTAAFGGVQIKLRVPAGTPAAFVDQFSHHQGERELVLPRGTHYYVHAVYKHDSVWYVEAEVVPDDFIAPLDASGKAVVSPSAKRFP